MKSRVLFLFFILFFICSCTSLDPKALQTLKPIQVFSIANKYKERRKYRLAIAHYKFVIDNFKDDDYSFDRLESKYNIALILEKTFKKADAKNYYQDIIDETDKKSLKDSFKVLAEKRLKAMENSQKSYKTDKSEDEQEKT